MAFSTSMHIRDPSTCASTVSRGTIRLAARPAAPCVLRPPVTLSSPAPTTGCITQGVCSHPAQPIACTSAAPAIPAATCRTSRRRRVQAHALYTGSSSQSDMEAAAERLAAFSDALQADSQQGDGAQGLSDGELAELLSNVPSIIAEEPQSVRAKLDVISKGTGMELGQVAGLIAHAPAAWNRSPEALVLKLSSLAKELDITAVEAGLLMSSVPPLFAINTFSLIKDRLDSLALRLGVSMSQVITLVTRQPLIYAVPPNQILSGVPRLCERLALSTEQALDLVVRVPVVLALEERLLNLQVGALSPVLGVSVSALTELLGRCLALVAVPAEVLGANVSNLAASLGVQEEDALDMLMTQPTLLTAQLPALTTALDCLETGLSLESRTQALTLLCQQPGLLYDMTIPTINEKIEALAALFEVSVSDMRSAVTQEPTLLLLAPFTVRAALTTAQRMGGPDMSCKRCLELLVQDPGNFMSLAHSEDSLSQWTQRLGLNEEQIAAMSESQPALMELAPTTVKARLESLAALFGIPVNIAAQLMARHPALVTIPPNVVITRVKALSTALGSSMQTLGVLVAKAPALLGCAVAPPGEVNRDLRSHVRDVSEVVAAYEYYTMEWLQRSLKEVAPRKMKSFSQMDRRFN